MPVPGRQTMCGSDRLAEYYTVDTVAMVQTDRTDMLWKRYRFDRLWIHLFFLVVSTGAGLGYRDSGRQCLQNQPQSRPKANVYPSGQAIYIGRPQLPIQDGPAMLSRNLPGRQVDRQAARGQWNSKPCFESTNSVRRSGRAAAGTCGERGCRYDSNPERTPAVRILLISSRSSLFSFLYTADMALCVGEGEPYLLLLGSNLRLRGAVDVLAWLAVR